MEKIGFGSALWKATKESTPPIATFAFGGPIIIGTDIIRNGFQLNQIFPSVIMVGAMYVIGSRVNEIVSESDLKVG